MPAEVSNALKAAIKTRGMRGFILHEVVGRDIFNLAYSSGTEALEVWHSQLTNSDDNQLVFRFC